MYNAFSEINMKPYMTGLLPIDYDFGDDDDDIDYDDSVLIARTWIFVDLSLPANPFHTVC